MEWFKQQNLDLRKKIEQLEKKLEDGDNEISQLKSDLKKVTREKLEALEELLNIEEYLSEKFGEDCLSFNQKGEMFIAGNVF